MNTQATLYIVATPIGNLEDITLRAIKTLQGAELILCEDKRVSSVLLKHLGIRKPLVSYHLHNEKSKLADTINLILQHKQVALISDAGTPLISDPGYLLIKECAKHNIVVTPIPGACSLVAALSVAGIPVNQFIFLGFLDKSCSKQEKILQRYSIEGATIAFFESPNRLVNTLKNLSKIYGSNQEVVVAKELTKMFEEIKRDSLTNLLQYYQDTPPKGEFIVLIHPKTNYEISQDDLIIQIKHGIENTSPSLLAKQLANKYNINKNTVYDEILKIKNLI
ncbi:Ribosomal RNA small subunit methyltransferase I [Candidatus Hepatincola sp. Pdp]